ncbi:cytochrome P450 3A5-like [Pomacea canaliculata]|uniref:cytochrome P450 3A5-like n=1 Tax=Pomacea canaliculata TaxID=400727 RepID=UPI000D72C82F|nr:cytochrome P450 3A5-like [Pomacea canaliculata]
MECLGWVSAIAGLVVTSLTLFIGWYWISQKRLHQTFQKMGIRGPKPGFLLGNLDEILKKGPQQCFTDWQKEYGNVYGCNPLWGHLLGRQQISLQNPPFLVVTDVELLREIMVKKFNAFPNRQYTPLADYKPWNEMLTMLQDDHWKHVRSLLSPSFSTSKLKKLCNSFSMDVIAGTAFGIEVDSLKTPGDPFLALIQRIRSVPSWMFTVLFLFPKFTPLLRRLGIAIAPEKDVTTLMNLIRRAIKERRQGTETYPDILQLMLEAENEGDKETEVDPEIDHSKELRTSAGWTRKGLTESEIEANSFIFLVAGYENTALMMAFLLFELANHPECLQKVQEELDEKLGKKEVDYQTVQELTYLEMCLNETMRLYPPGVTIDGSRENVLRTRLGDVHVPKGMHIVFPTFTFTLIHTGDPMTSSQRGIHRRQSFSHPFSFLPFGYGPRNCIGMRLVLVEMKMAIAALLRQFSPVRSLRRRIRLRWRKARF